MCSVTGTHRLKSKDSILVNNDWWWNGIGDFVYDWLLYLVAK